MIYLRNRKCNSQGSTQMPRSCPPWLRPLKPGWPTSAPYLCPTHPWLSQVTTSSTSHPLLRHLPWAHLVPMSGNQVLTFLPTDHSYGFRNFCSPLPVSWVSSSLLHFQLVGILYCLRWETSACPWPAGTLHAPAGQLNSSLLERGRLDVFHLNCWKGIESPSKRINKGYQDLTFKQVNEVEKNPEN